MQRLIAIFFFVAFSNVHAQNVGIGTDTPETSAQLDVMSKNKGFLPPRMTFAERNRINEPAAGLMIWCTDCDTSGQMQVYNGFLWTNMIGATASAPMIWPVTICGQIWMKKNLDVVQYRNGDPIPQVTDSTQWANLTTGAWCWYNNDSITYAAAYGRLYNWYAVNDPRGLAPVGWHIPTNTEWSNLVNTCLGGVGGALKDTGTKHWAAPNTAANNSSGFSALGGGYRNTLGSFVSYKTFGFWWSSTQDSGAPTTARNWALSNSSNSVLFGNSGKWLGFSVRCVKD